MIRMYEEKEVSYEEKISFMTALEQMPLIDMITEITHTCAPTSE